MTDRSGQRIDHYHLVQRLGEGGFGEVYLAEDVYHARSHVAIKILPVLADSDIAAFLNEARTIRLKHSHIVQVQDFGIDNHLPFIVMDYAPHGTLRQLHPKGTRLLLDAIVSYVHQIAGALQYAHNERVIHRDIKPENLLLGPRKEILVSDFGIATIASTSRSQSAPEMAGTISYMAPEQIQGKPRFASDQYALAIIVYEWLCGERPFIGTPMEIATQHMLKPPPSLCEKVPNLSPEIEQVILTALAKDTKDRFASIIAFATALEQAYREQIRRLQLRSSAVVPVIPPGVSQAKSLPAVVHVNPGVANKEDAGAPVTKVIPMPSSAYVPASLAPIQRERFANPGVPLSPNVNAAVSPVRKTSKVKRLVSRRVAVLLVLLTVALLGSGAYAILHVSGSIVNVDGTLSSATGSMEQARGDVNANRPSNALQDLAKVRDDLLRIQGSSLSDAQRTTFNDLQGTFVRTVQQAGTIYNHQYQIVTLPCDSTNTTPITSGNTQQATSLAVLQGGAGKNSLTYILASDKNIYSLTPQGTLGTKFQFPASGRQVETLANDGSRLVALFSTPAQGQSISYGLSLLAPQQDGTLKEANSTILNTPAGYTPKFVTIVNTTVSVVLVQQIASTQPQILNYTLSGTGVGQHFNTPPTDATISVSKNIVDVIASGMGGQGAYLFFLLSDGDVQSLPLVDGSNSTSSTLVNVQLTASIPSPLALSANFALSVQTPVPTPVSVTTTTLSVPGATLLAAGTELGENGHFYVVAMGGNGVGPRILDLKITQRPVGATPSASLYMTLVQQYAPSSALSNTKGISVDPKGNGFYLLTQNGQGGPTLQLASVNLPLQKTCLP